MMGGAPYVQLSGRNVITTAVFTAFAITDVGIYLSNPINVSAYKSISIDIQNTLDNASHNANPIVTVVSADNNKGLITGSGTSVSKTLSYATYGTNAAHIIITPTDFATLSSLIGSIKIQLQASNAPTQGSITVNILGVPN